jgi:DNA-binding NarL/FixJ family response regulator
MNKITVLLVDDHMLLRQGVRVLLEAEGDISILGEAETGRQAVEMTQKLQPDVVVMDISMPNLNGVEATRQITRKTPLTKVVILSAYNDDEYVQHLTEAGAVGYVVKHSGAAELSKAIREARKGNAYFSPSITKRLLDHYRRSHMKGRTDQKRELSLTSRESEVVQLVAEGRANKQIAAELSLSIKTVEKYRQQVMDKLNIHETAGLTRYAIAKGIVENNPKEKILSSDARE